MKRWLFWLLVCSVWSVAPSASAFCGFYVGSAGGKLYNNATMVVLMREGTRTVISMQNNYQGPPKDFAMVVPVPVVLQEEQVKTLPNDVFDRVDRLAAPRLVEYWEQDPCDYARQRASGAVKKKSGRPPLPKPSAPGAAEDLGVTIEAQFAVGEYEVVILSARDSSGLDTWLRQEKYNIPQGAEPVLAPYVQQGMKFFVAKVDANKVKFVDGQAQLSPLRFHYDANTFFLPVRLGLLNSKGTQDLIVHILSKGQRYEVANYDNVTIPTNIDVTNYTRKVFGSFYASLFDHTMKRHPKAVVTEYAWSSASCDPCPSPPLSMQDIATLGADVMNQGGANQAPEQDPLGGLGEASQPPEGNQLAQPKKSKRRPPRPWFGGGGGGYVLTRLHTRYDQSILGEDLVFRAAPPIVGGRERGSGANLEQGAKQDSYNNFQARYIIRHRWQGPVRCSNPQRGIWGGPWPSIQKAYDGPEPAQKLAFVQRGIPLTSFVKGRQMNRLGTLVTQGQPLGTPVPDPLPLAPPGPPAPDPEAAPAADPTASASPEPPPAPVASQPSAPAAQPPAEPANAGGCAGCRVGERPSHAGWSLILLALVGWRRRRHLV